MDIDLHQHAVVEASAGTGKTYTIARLVLRLLTEAQVPLERILLVTFTEKATGELKERLRTLLEETLPRQPENGPVLRAALDMFDQAPIFTIHGFCQRLLAEYPMEQRQDIRTEVVHDRDLIEPALREVQRRVWREKFGPQLQRVLDLAQYNRDTAQKWEDKVKEVAGKFKPECDHVLLPAPPKDELLTQELEEECRRFVLKLRGLAGKLPADLSTHPWVLGFQEADLDAKLTGKGREEFLEPLLAWLGDAETDREPVRSFLQFQEGIRVAFEEFEGKGFKAFLTMMDKKTQRDMLKLCPGLEQTIEELEEFRQVGPVARLAHQLAALSVGWVRAELARHKEQRGQISFDDMIADMDRALDPEKNTGAGHFQEILRSRFAYAIIDEFQDTDPLQWRIFRRVFLEETAGLEDSSRGLKNSQAGPRLIVVGDPKQAIFGFRGADLPTYLQAAKEMTDKHGARLYPLQFNWRSVPELLGALNRLFEKGEWFAADPGLRYLPVKAPPACERLTEVVADPSKRAALTIIDVQDAEYANVVRRHYAQFVVGEIGRLLKAGLVYKRQGEEKRLGAGDICLLVFRRSEATCLADELRQADIPFSFYKQPGLWDSPEAWHLYIVLEALANPDEQAAFRKALLTCFFDLKPDQLARCEDVPARHRARQLFHHWLGLVEKRDWSALFRSLLEETGALLRDIPTGRLDRRISNFRHLIATLEEAAYRDSLDLLDLLELFKNRRGRGDDPEADMQPVETERPKVKIMTVHSSKGLEFPVVFLAGGFTKRGAGGYAQYRDAQGRRVFDLGPDKKARDAHSREDMADWRRLLYVAMTRAMLKLYVPHVRAELGRSYAGPLVKVLAPALIQADPGQLGFPVVGEIGSMDRKACSPAKKAKRKPAPEEEAEPSRRGEAIKLEGDLFPVLDPDLSRRRIVVRSFSSLHRAAARKLQEGANFGEEMPRADDEEPDTREDPLRGPVFGDIVHLALEAVDFALVGKAAEPGDLIREGHPCRPLIDAPIKKLLPRMWSRTPLEQLEVACRERVAALVWHALRVPLPKLGARLCDIPSADRIAELEFLFPQHGAEAPPAEVRLEEGFLTGFMDLVFRKDGQYYLVDWKTNLLDGYDPAAIAQAMDEGDYHRQYRLYLQALARWLWQQHGPAFDPEKNLGGVYYLFLRGLKVGDETAGIFVHKPEPADLELSMVLKTW